MKWDENKRRGPFGVIRKCKMVFSGYEKAKDDSHVTAIKYTMKMEIDKFRLHWVCFWRSFRSYEWRYWDKPWQIYFVYRAIVKGFHLVEETNKENGCK